ncbi:hypothetical protein Clacol_000832 [Clathrus columnatus]|uniref:Uncharacterized protein n=1 Tax=Clathrus columnatus TaxID=1419009 RepID=A0AAV5A0B2_9AGAM|nr:hypothetical protein Clacol_000832 [Clathrus columnatus]
MSVNPLLNAKRLKPNFIVKGELKRGGLIITPLPISVKDVSTISHDTDVFQPLPSRDTPVIERNRIMRREPIEGRPSLGRRGKRASSSFENKGLIPQPHPTLDPANFHKHIDLELPDAHRTRHLLVWCASRATNSNSGSSSSLPESSSSSSTSLPPLPPLTAEGMSVLRDVQKEVQKMLLEQRIDISFTGHSNEASTSTRLKPHEQNVKNQHRESDFTQYIQRCEKEGEAWSEVIESYQSRRARLLESLSRKEPDFQEWIPPDASDPLYERESQGAQLARGCKERAARKRDKSPLSIRVAEVENKVDRLHGILHVADQASKRTARHLDKRFAALSAALAARSRPIPSTSSVDGSSSLHLISSNSRSHTTSGSTEPPDTIMLLRALARTDMENPKEIGDAARKVARDARNSLGPSERERKLTAVTRPPLGTPRRPGTPRQKHDTNDNGGNR